MRRRCIPALPIDPLFGAALLRAEADRAAVAAASEVQRTASPGSRTDEPRAEDACTCTMHAPASRAARAPSGEGPCNSAACRFPRAEHPSRTAESFRSEAAYRRIAERQRTTADRLAGARLLLSVMERHDVSRDRLAAMVGVTEKSIRKMLSAEVSIPVHMPARMPAEMRAEFYDGLGAIYACDAASSTARVLERIRRERDIEAAHDLEDKARELSRELARGR